MDVSGEAVGAMQAYLRLKRYILPSGVAREALQAALPFIAPPSAARELALEDRARLDAATAALISLTEAGIPTDVQELLIVGDPSRGIAPGSLSKAIATVLRSLSSPDHIADAGKLVEGDGRADLERFWRPISEADKSITFEDTFDIGDGKSMTIRNSDHFWVRDADGRVYEATWSDHKGGYWWDLEGESPADPVEYMPHPLSLPSAPASEGAE